MSFPRVFGGNLFYGCPTKTFGHDNDYVFLRLRPVKTNIIGVHTNMQPDGKLLEALRDIIEGKSVKRSKHDLIFDGKNITDVFIETLCRHRFLPTTVREIHIQPSERIPAFIIEQHTAYFGWVFWEKFSQLRLRKLFGTVIRNTKGDWLIQLPSNSTKLIYADTSQIFEMDIDRPFEL